LHARSSSAASNVVHVRGVTPLTTKRCRATTRAYVEVLADPPDEQAAALGVDIKEVYRLRQATVTLCRNKLGAEQSARSH
jgi:hypothetical protein